MNLGWAVRFYKKRIGQWLSYKLARAPYYSMTLDGVTVKLGYLDAYHHAIAKSMARMARPPFPPGGVFR